MWAVRKISQRHNRKTNSLRIIGGKWRSRRIQFFDSPKVRPTTDRVRETVFNWLATDILNSNCLDLFSGSGALGFEAASRGALQVVMVEKDAKIAKMLIQQKKILDAKHLHIIQQDALSYLKQATETFNIIFIDPPYDSGMHLKALQIIEQRQLLDATGLLYIETSAHQEISLDLTRYKCVKEKIAGQVRYALYEMLN